MSSARRRCVIQGCSSWEFDSVVHMCRNCCAQYSQVADAIRKYQKASVLKPGLVVTKPIPSPFYLGLQEGDKVDILDILPDNTSIIVRTLDETIGYYNIDCVATEDEIVQKFQIEEERRKEEEEKMQKEAQRQAEELYEEQLKERMRMKAQEEKERRAAEAEMRRLEQDRLMEQLEQMRLVEQKRQQEAEARRLALKAEQERIAQKEHERRVREAHEMKRVWDLQKQQYEKEKRLANQPQWKRDLLEKRR
eukprot:gene10501-2629_t